LERKWIAAPAPASSTVISVVAFGGHWGGSKYQWPAGIRAKSWTRKKIKFARAPVRLIEDDRKCGRKRSRRQRNQPDRQNAERDRDDREVGEKRDRREKKK